MAATGVHKVQRTSKGLVDALFDSIDKLNSKEIDIDSARAISHTARSIVAIARLELDYRKESDTKELKSLAIDHPK